MLPARSRVRRAADFTAIVRRGRRVGTRTLVVHVLPAASGAPDGPTPDALTSGDRSMGVRVGFAVGRSVGPAVARNRVKRRLRHLVRERLARLPEDRWIVVRALPAAASRSYRELGDDLDRALERALGRAPRESSPDR